MSELKVYERLHIAALHLDNQIYQHQKNTSLSRQRQAYHTPATSVLPAVGTPMKHVPDAHQCENFPVTLNQLPEKFRMEGREDLANHRRGSFKSRISEENPTEANEVKGQENSPKLPQPHAMILFRMIQKAPEILMNRQGNSVQTSPDNKIPRGSMPESAQKHCHNQIDIHTKFPFSVSAKRDI